MSDFRNIQKMMFPADAQIKCKRDRILYAHQCILAARSSFFKHELGLVQSQGGAYGLVNLTDAPYNIVSAVVEWIYTDDYKLIKPRMRNDMKRNIEDHLEIASLANRLNLEDLHNLATSKCTDYDVIVGSNYGQNIRDFPNMVKKIYHGPKTDITPKLIEALVKFGLKHRKAYFENDCTTHNSFEQRFLEVPEFLLDIAKELTKEIKAMKDVDTQIAPPPVTS